MQVRKEETTLLWPVDLRLDIIILPPMIVFPRVHHVSEALKVSAPPGNMIAAQNKKGWITTELYLKWFKFSLNKFHLQDLFSSFRMDAQATFLLS